MTTAQFVTTRHGQVAVHADEQPGEPIVLLHGLGGDHLQVQSFLPDPQVAPDLVMRRIAIDQRGHGDTTEIGEPRTLDIRSFGEDVHDVILGLSQFGLATPVTLLGISMGAAVTIELACRFPELVDRVILIRPSWDGQSRSDNAMVFPVLADYLARYGPEGLGAFTDTPEYQSVAQQSPPMAASLRKQFARKDAQQRSAVLASVPRSPDMRPLSEIKAIAVPALVLGAPGDPVHPLAFAETLAAAIPGARLTRLPMKRESPGEHEDALRAAVKGFLRDTRRS